MPLVGVATGALAGIVYWIGAQVWPTSIAVVLSMLANRTDLCGAGARTANLGLATFVFCRPGEVQCADGAVSASLPYHLPANLALGLIMIAGHACTALVVVSVPATATHPASLRRSRHRLGAGFLRRRR